MFHSRGEDKPVSTVLRRVCLCADTTHEIEAKIRLWMRPYLRGDARYSIAVTEGDVLDEVSNLVKEYSADLLIIGTHAATRATNGFGAEFAPRGSICSIVG
jgi:nucleotide-binding universal stress UspA family protein